jgi:hypothetical protein
MRRLLEHGQWTGGGPGSINAPPPTGFDWTNCGNEVRGNNGNFYGGTVQDHSHCEMGHNDDQVKKLKGAGWFFDGDDVILYVFWLRD